LLTERWDELVAAPIPLSESVKAALNSGRSVVLHDPTSPASAAYRALAERTWTEGYDAA